MTILSRWVLVSGWGGGGGSGVKEMPGDYSVVTVLHKSSLSLTTNSKGGRTGGGGGRVTKPFL